jgi:hypothetical protein
LLDKLKYGSKQTADVDKLEMPNLYQGLQSCLWRDILPDVNGRHVLLILAADGPQSVVSLKREIDPNKLEHRGIPSKYAASLHDLQVRRAIEELERDGLVKTISNSKSKAQVVSLTFHGVYWYLKYGGNDKKINARIKDVFLITLRQQKKKRLTKKELLGKTVEEPLSFIKQWAFLRTKWEEKFDNSIVEIINYSCIDDKKQREIKTLNIHLETFFWYRDFTKPKLPTDVTLERNFDVASFLMAGKAEYFKEAYIAFLLNGDINFLSSVDEGDIEKYLSNLDSFRELLYFEKNKTTPKQFFSNDSLKRFLPKYSELEHYFTGMIVDKMLWDKKPFDDYSYEI